MRFTSTSRQNHHRESKTAKGVAAETATGTAASMSAADEALVSTVGPA